jgi:hypothetical protein
MIRLPLAVSLLALSAIVASPASAQVGVRASTAQDDAPIVIQGKKKELAKALRQLIQPSDNEQLARFEDKVCPIVIGMPRDWTVKMTQMIRDNIEAVGGKLEKPGCKPNALAIFIDQPKELVDALHDDAPYYFNMTPRQFDKFAAQPGPVWSWHVTDMRSRDGNQLAQGSMQGNDFAVVKQASATRLYSNIRQDMLAGFVVLDRPKTVGKTLRQIADLVTMHLLLDVRLGATGNDKSSILSLFAERSENETIPARFSNFDRGALTGFYTQRENNRTAAQQQNNIAEAIRRGAGEDDADNK